MKRVFVQTSIAIVSCISIYAENRNVVPINVVSGFDDNPILVGVVSQEEDAHSIQWSFANTREFSVEIPERTSGLTLVLLKRDSIPVVKALTSESLAEAITIEFLEGKSVSGTVVAAKDGIPIPEGLVTVEFDEQLGIPIPEKESVFAWKLEEGGAFEIRGLPVGAHIVTVRAPGYMPAQQNVVVELEDEIQELHFQLTKAVHIEGRIVDWRYGTTVEGTFDTVVSPPESQTVDIQSDFDDAGNFQLGPFAEDAAVEFVAHTASELCSRPHEVSVPAEDVVVYVYQWIRLVGTVQDRDTGEPIPEFSYFIGRRMFDEEETKIVDTHGKFNVDIREDHNLVFCIVAPGFSFWASEVIDFEHAVEGAIDLGIIALEPVLEVRGRVLDRQTGEPIEGAEITRDDSYTLGTDPRSINVLRWNSWKVKTTTNAEGEFQLSGIPTEGSGISAWAPGFAQETQIVTDIQIPLEFELTPTGTISGQVVSLTGEPVAAMIHFTGGGRRTDDGNFQFKVRAGTHRYKAFADSGTSKVVEVTVESGQSVEGVRLVIEVVGRVYGTIEGLLEGETVMVGVDGVAGAYERVTSNGEFEITGVPEGQHVVKSKTSFGRELEGNVVVDDTLEGRIDLSFPGSSTLSGRLVSGPDGLEDVKLLAQPESPGLPEVQTRSKRDGSYRFQGLIDGYYQVEVPSRNFTQQVLVQGDTYSDLHLSANRLYGKIQGSGSVEGAKVRLTGGSEDQEISLWTNVGANGSYRFDGVPLGTYTVRITHSKYEELAQEVVVDQNQVELDFQLDDAMQN